MGLWFVWQPYPQSYTLYEVSVRQARCLPPDSFRFHLTMDTLALGYVLAAIRPHSGLAPVRHGSCRAYQKLPHPFRDVAIIPSSLSPSQFLIGSFEKIPFLQLPLRQPVALLQRQPVICLRRFLVLLDSPSVLIELPDSVMRIRESAVLV